MRAFEIEGWLEGKKIRRKNWCKEDYWQFDADLTLWIASNCDDPKSPGLVDLFSRDDWEVYEEPKPKRTVYEWIYTRGKTSYLGSGLYTEEEAAHVFKHGSYLKTGRQFEVDCDQ